MGGYIGATAVGLTTTAADVQGDITSTDTTPELILKNTSEEDTEGGREGKITFKGEQSGGEETTLAQIESAHDGTADDQKGDLIFKTNDGSDGASPTEAMRIDSSQNVGIGRSPRTRLEIASGNSGGDAGLDAPVFRITNTTASSDWDSGDVNGTIEFYTDDTSANAPYDTAFIKSVGDDNNGTLPSGALLFGTATYNAVGGAVERMRIDSSGNFGIGTTSPDGRADIAQDQNTTKFTSPHLALTATDTTDTTGFTGISYAASTLTNYGWTVGALRATSGANSAFVFTQHNNSASGTERMRINGNGELLIGTTDSIVYNEGASGNSGLVLVKDGYYSAARQNGPTAFLNRQSTTGDLINFYYNGVKKGSISTNGSNTAYNTSSDYRLKENVRDITDGITRLKQLSPKRFNFIAEPDTTVDGFLAHEAQTVIPEAITGTKDEVEVWKEHEELPEDVSVGDNKLDADGNTIPEYQSIDQSKLVPLLTAALQEAIAKIETLETKVTALEGA